MKGNFSALALNELEKNQKTIHPSTDASSMMIMEKIKIKKIGNLVQNIIIMTC
jgi:hypothetical protein